MNYRSRLTLQCINIFVIFCLSTSCLAVGAKRFSYAHASVVTSAGVQIDVEVADTPEKRHLGLSFRKELKPKKGMLFIFERRQMHSFWMKDMFIPIDIIWLDNHRIAHIEHSVPPPVDGESPITLNPEQEVNFVLELAAGQAESLNLKVGQKVKYIF
ncbi:MAG: DUF192 domain-containing protein [SAR324 cluster bacterium]|nr:DUF192 domain-containing protein [SAR324 cluster bacterium]